MGEFLGLHIDDFVKYEQETEISKEMLQVQVILSVNIPQFEMQGSVLSMCTFKKLFA